MFDLPQPGETVRTTCPYCGVGCGVLATRQADGSVDIAGDPNHPANFGRLCSKGSALGQTLAMDDRILSPRIDGQDVAWDQALNEIADRFTQTIAEHGPDSVAIYGSGQLLIEDYYVANKFMKGFVGAANLDTNSRLCMASTAAGHRRAFGSDTVPGCYEDLELADLIVLVGSNLAWCHPVLFQRISAAKEQRPNMRIVLVDPRKTMTADIADLHLPIKADGDSALFAGLLKSLNDNGQIDQDYIAQHTNGFDAALAEVSSFDVAKVAAQTGLDAQDIQTLYDWFGETPKTVTVFSQGVNQSSVGTDKVNTIINCHLAVGNVGQPGAGPFSVTGQPNAMGGREVGGLAHLLAAQMEFANPAHVDRVSRFWNAAKMATKPGLKAAELIEAIEADKVKLVWVLSTNPVVSMPEADRVRAALQKCPTVIVSDMIEDTDTGRCADIVLPAMGWGEKKGTVTNSERRMSRQRAFMEGPELAKPDWWAITQVAQRMGFADAFAYARPDEILREHAALTAFENDNERSLNLAPLADVSAESYEKIEPAQWPLTRDNAARLFADGQFNTPDKRAKFVAVKPPAPISASEFILNTGRVRDHWHTMTRTAKT